MEPEISVILPTYNRSRAPVHFMYLQECLKSLLAQDIDKPFEILIGTEVPQAQQYERLGYLLELIADIDAQADRDRIKLLVQRHESRSGHGPVDNDLHRLAKGRFCTRPLGDDEIFEPQFLRKLYEALTAAPPGDGRKPPILAYGDFVDIDAAGNVLRERRRGKHHIERLKKECYIGICVMYDRAAWRQAGGYRAMLAAEDHDMWLRMAELGDFVHVHEFLGRWRDWEGNLTTGVRRGHIEQGRIYTEDGA